MIGVLSMCSEEVFLDKQILQDWIEKKIYLTVHLDVPQITIGSNRFGNTDGRH